MSIYRNALGHWDIQSALTQFNGLTLLPGTDDIVITGVLNINHTLPGYKLIQDTYQISCYFPLDNYPHELPQAFETLGRISSKYHHLENDSLCLGSRARLHTVMEPNPTACSFIEHCVIPYLYCHSYFEQFGVMPYGELIHGNAGLIQDYERLFLIQGEEACIRMLELTAMKRRLANKQKCPCKSGLRLGRCHHHVLNSLRKALNKRFCLEEILTLKSEKTNLLRHTRRTIEQVAKNTECK